MSHSDYLACVAEAVREARRDPRSEHELVSLALTEPDEDLAWQPVSILQHRGTREVLEVARQLHASACPIERKLAVHVLSQLGVPERTFPRESAALLLVTLEAESDEDVLSAACSAFGHTHAPQAVPALARLRSHPSPEVRFSLTFGLSGYTEPEAVATLIHLSADPADADIRDWATFALGSQIDLDTPAIREALYLRLSDPDPTTRGEALVGLARRKDERVIEPLLRELRQPPAEGHDFAREAAEEFGDPRLLAALAEQEV